MGACLVGHLRFIQLLLTTIFEEVKELNEVIYAEEPYDKTCRRFDLSHDFLSYQEVKKAENQPPASSNEAKPTNPNSG